MRRFNLSIVLALAVVAPGCSSSPANLTPGAMPSAKPTVTPSSKPTVTPSSKPTVTPSSKPTVTPSSKPTVTPSPKPTATPSPRPSATPTATPNPDPNYKVLYNFKTNEYAIAGLTALNGSLYGSFGTGYRPLNPDWTSGPGGVYEIAASGAERVVNADGAPYGGLIVGNGLLYGTGSGSNGATYGGVFSLTTSGKRNLLYDVGIPPTGDLTDLDGELYVTVMGFADDCFCDNWGAEFAVSLSGTVRFIYTFDGGASGGPDGEYPASGLVYSKGEFYGTTSCYDQYYGAFYCPGTVFSMTPTGILTTIYHFKGGSDGIHPFASLVYLGGLFYGTTSGGGTSDHGTVFAISPSGSEHVVYRFKDTPDGSEPRANLTIVGDELYGTTIGGGANGLGSIFKVTKSGGEEVVHSFRQADGVQPNRDVFGGRLVYGGGLLYHDGMLYGTTTAGGANGQGTVFERKP